MSVLKKITHNFPTWESAAQWGYKFKNQGIPPFGNKFPCRLMISFSLGIKTHCLYNINTNMFSKQDLVRLFWWNGSAITIQNVYFFPKTLIWSNTMNTSQNLIFQSIIIKLLILKMQVYSASYIIQKLPKNQKF